MQDFRKLDVWQRAHELTLAIYRATRRFPAEERYGLTGQLRRSSVSVAANIAEGCGRQSNADLTRFLHIAMGSASELECELLIADDLGFLPNGAGAQLLAQLEATKRQLNAFIQRVKHPHQ